MRTLAVVPARGGSKGLPGKNARPFLGEPLIGHAIRIAQETCDALVVTTDAQDLAEIARGYSAPVHMRPAELAQDTTRMLPVIRDAILGRDGDVIVLLQPTSPLRTPKDVRAALAMLEADWQADSVASVRRVPSVYVPDRVLYLDDRRLFPATPEGSVIHGRQAAREAYVRCGTVYAIRRRVLDRPGKLLPFSALLGFDCRPLVLPGDDLSIDTEADFLRLEAEAQNRQAIGRCPGL